MLKVLYAQSNLVSSSKMVAQLRSQSHFSTKEKSYMYSQLLEPLGLAACFDLNQCVNLVQYMRGEEKQLPSWRNCMS